MINQWTFDQKFNCAAITDLYVLENNHPILGVIHYSDDNSWAFLSGQTNTTADGRVISMLEAYNIDNSILSISTLKPGYSAFRINLNSEWIIKKISED